MNIQKLDINTLKPATYNPRKKLKKGDPEYQKILNSVEAFGYVDPIIINSDYTIIGGHQRWTVLKDLGYSEVDCVVVDLDKSKEKALNVALNKISGEWDAPLLAELLADIGDMAELTGFSNYELDELLNIEQKEEEIEKIIYEQSLQIEPPQEYLIIIAKDLEEFDAMKNYFNLKMVCRGGYKEGSQFNTVSTERILTFERVKNANSSTEQGQSREN